MKKTWCLGVLVVNLILVGLIGSVIDAPVAIAADNSRSSELWTQANAQDWAGWRLDGVKLGDTARIPALTLDSASAKNGSDPYGAGDYKGGNYYNGGNYSYGEAIAPYYGSAGGFDNAIVSWNAETPTGTWLELKLRALVKGHWSKYYTMGIWASDTSTIKRHSLDGQNDADGRVETDTLTLSSRAEAFQVKVTLFSNNLAVAPVLRRVSVSTVRNGTSPALASPRTAWGKDLDVPQRSQMIYPDGGEVWCSPTSLSMVMAYLGDKYSISGLNQSVPQVAGSTYDWIYRGNGNWPFNVAYAANGLPDVLYGYVSRFHSLVQVESWITAGLPVIVSVAYTPGRLPGSPISATDGHLLVMRGFDSNGNPIVNDPAADPRKGQNVRIVYPRAAFERAWQEGSGGTVYLLYPRGANVPLTNALKSWTNDNSPKYAYAEIENLWRSNDEATAQGNSGRGWIWGPSPTTSGLQESYAEGPDGWRTVQYFDKSRMEVTAPQADRSSKWFVTNGLLTIELVSGRMQTGDNRYEERSPAQVSVAGDPGSGPTYATFNSLTSLPGLEQSRRASDRTGQAVTAQLNSFGDMSVGNSAGVTNIHYNTELGHNIPDAFWNWMNDPARSGINDWVFVLGYPVTEPFWVDVTVGGKAAHVLVQLFQRRALTYNPANAAPWQVEMGNIGQHYYKWRYNS